MGQKPIEGSNPSLSARSSKRGHKAPFACLIPGVAGIRTLDGLDKWVRPAPLAAPARRSEAQAPGGWAAQPTVIPHSPPDPAKGAPVAPFVCLAEVFPGSEPSMGCASGFDRRRLRRQHAEAKPTVIPRSSPDPVKGLDGPFCMSVHVANGPGVFEHCAELCVKRCDDCCDGKVSRGARPFTFRCPGQLRGVRPPGRRRARGYGRRSSRRDHPLPVAG